MQQNSPNKKGFGHRACTVVLCAGKSSRMNTTRSKMLLPLLGKPMCFWMLDTALAMQTDPVVAVVSNRPDGVADAVTQRYGPRVLLARQAQPRGTGDALRSGLAVAGSRYDTVLVLYGDTPLLRTETLTELLSAPRRPGTSIAMLTTRCADPTGYGRIVRNGSGHVTRIVEDKEASREEKTIDEVNVGVYAFAGDFVRQTLPKLSPRQAGGEYYLTDLVALAVSNSGAASPIADLPADKKETAGVNDQIQLAAAHHVLRERILHGWMRKGVACPDPNHVAVDDGCVLAPDVVLEQGVQLRGRCHIAARCVIGTGCILTDCALAEGVRVEPYCVCEGVRIEKNARIGPFARIRPRTVVGQDAKIGNFVEVKNAHLRPGVKAGHLAYIGDAAVGAESNIGAGVVVCNYDGVTKHATSIGARAFIGSNSTLIAPVSVGDQTYVAAGTTVTHDVPRDSLAVGRARLCTKEKAGSALRQRLQHRAASKNAEDR